jgi:hypothetical protein
MDPTVKHLLSLDAIRERTNLLSSLAEGGKLTHFDLHEKKLDAVADFVTGVIEVGIPSIDSLSLARRPRAS